eukprot:2711287-Pleurochrysis_carterae.AAC.1
MRLLEASRWCARPARIRARSARIRARPARIRARPAHVHARPACMLGCLLGVRAYVASRLCTASLYVGLLQRALHGHFNPAAWVLSCLPYPGQLLSYKSTHKW